MKKLKIKVKFPEESKKTKQAIETLINEGYVFHSYCNVSIDGVKKGFSIGSEKSKV